MVKDLVRNRSNSVMLALLLTIPVLIDVLNVVVQQFDLGNTSVFTLIVHLLVFLYMIRHIKIYKEDLEVLLCIYALFLTNFIIFSDTRSYLLSANMLYVYFYALPCSIVSIRKIRDWNEFLNIFKPFPLAATVLGVLMILFLNYSRYLVYMDFSYAMLPSVCANYYYARMKKEDRRHTGSVIHLFAFIISFIEIVVFGARATIFFALIYVLAFEIMRSDRKIIYKIIIAVVFGISIHMVQRYKNTIMNYLATFSIFRESRLFMKFAAGKLFYSQGREQLKILCEHRIRTMGLSITGFFGDRAFCGSDPYPHNIIREVLMSWGWIIGVLLLLALSFLIVKTLLQHNTNRDVVVFLFVAVFARYFVSGSYIQESKFYLFLFAIIGMLQSSEYRPRIKFTFGR